MIINQIYSEVTEYAKATYSALNCASRYENITESFPFLSLYPISQLRPIRSATLDNDDQVKRITFEAQIYANDSTTCNGIASKVEEKFKSLGFFQEMREVIPSMDPKVMRVVSRFTRTITGE